MRQFAPVLLLIALAAALSALRNAGQVSPDLLATWMAGRNFAAGALDQIYPAAGPVFLMRPPDAWVTQLAAEGHAAAIYPFIYPPLWAWAAGGLTRIADYPQVLLVANVLNPVLLGLTFWLAARTARGRLSDAAFVGAGLLMCAFTAIAIVALEQNQPQILVAFLTVLAVERLAHGAPRCAGAALALAAAIKLFPALFVLFWIVRGERRAAVSFFAAGLALGLLSLAVAGWPLHALFLDQIRTISGTALLTFFTYSLDAVAAKLFFHEAMTFVPDLRLDTSAGWRVLEKPPLWRLLDVAALVLVLLGLASLARRTADPLFWPLAVTVLALAGALSWGYHYLAAIAFLPALLDRLGTVRGATVAGLILLPSSPAFLLSRLPGLDPQALSSVLGTLAMATYAGLLLALVLRPRPVPDRPLRSEPAPL